jgi:hypothetical protein
MLLEYGADVNAQGGHFNNALQAASEVVQLLPEHGADISSLSGYYDEAVNAAATRGHFEIVEKLKKAKSRDG